MPARPHWEVLITIDADLAPTTLTPPTVGVGKSRAVTVNLVVAAAETAALATAALLTGSAAMRTQTVTSLADIAGGVFLLIGVIRSARPADEQHPRGYGRERSFWSFVAAIGIFIGGFGVAVAVAVAVAETVHAFITPHAAGAYPVGYSVLAVVIALDAVALGVGVRPLLCRAQQRQISLARLLWRGTDPRHHRCSQ
jgi:divalent metal cation (Fe/Co/Zn/Cd) transporter